MIPLKVTVYCISPYPDSAPSKRHSPSPRHNQPPSHPHQAPRASSNNRPLRMHLLRRMDLHLHCFHCWDHWDHWAHWDHWDRVGEFLLGDFPLGDFPNLERMEGFETCSLAATAGSQKFSSSAVDLNLHSAAQEIRQLSETCLSETCSGVPALCSGSSWRNSWRCETVADRHR